MRFALREVTFWRMPVVRAAGGLLWRAGRPGEGKKGGARVRLAVIHRPHRNDWSLPKGKLADGESELEGALREVEEETGMSCRVDRPLGTTSYIDRKGRPKVVVYWLMQATGGVFEPGPEIDEVRWLELDEVMALLSYPRDRTLLGALVAERAEIERAGA